MKKFLFYIVSILCLTACSSSDDPVKTEIPDAPKSERTILAYLSANNDLDQALRENIVWMYQGLAKSDKQSTLVIYFRPSSSNWIIKENEFLIFKTDGKGNINGKPVLADSLQQLSKIMEQAEIHTAPEGVSVDPAVMKSTLKEMQTLAPAKNYGLIFGSHATGWLEGDVTTDNSVITYSFGVDGKYSINIPEFAKAVEESFDSNTLDFILFDACMMGTAEVCYELRNATRYCIASVMETPAIGFPYNLVLDELYNKDINFQKLCDKIVAFNKENNLWGTYAAMDCTKMQELADAVKTQILNNQDRIEELDYKKIQQYGVSYNGFGYFSFDVAEVIKALNNGAMPTDFQQVLDETVVAKNCIDDYNGSSSYQLIKDKNKFCGIGMYLPLNVSKSWNNYYETSIEWYEAAGWNQVR